MEKYNNHQMHCSLLVSKNQCNCCHHCSVHKRKIQVFFFCKIRSKCHLVVLVDDCTVEDKWSLVSSETAVMGEKLSIQKCHG